MKNLAIIDIDGTITDFYKVDREIISELYGNNKVIKLLDKILWKINSMDIITNRFFIFKLRIMLYSFLNKSSFDKDFETYKEKYIAYAKHYFKTFMKNEYVTIKEKGLKVLLLTCDPFDGFCDNRVTVVQNKIGYVLDNVLGKYDKIYVIGNNYMDDIKIGLRLRKKIKESGSVSVFYIGNSSVLKRYLKNKDVFTFQYLKDAVKKI